MSDMIHRIKILALFLIVIVASPVAAQLNYSVSGNVNGCKGCKIFLSEIRGKQVLHRDSAFTDSLCNFYFKMPEYTGVLRLSLNDSDYTDIVFNKENIQFKFPSGDFDSLPVVVESKENKVYFDFLSKIKPVEDSADIMISMGQMLYDQDSKGNAATLKKLIVKIDELKKRKNELCKTFSEEHKNLFASKLIRSNIFPDYKEYMKGKDAAPYPNEFAFLKEHFFDYTDFSDSTLVNSDVFFKKCGDYFGYFADPPSVEKYNECIDFIIVRAQANKNVYNYIVSTLVSTFEHSDWEEVYLHIVEAYNKNNTCSDDATWKELNKNATILKSLKTGSTAPDIVAKDLEGQTHYLDSLKSKYTLVMFWASWCEFCEDAMPDLKRIYTEYNSKGLEIFAVSCDSVQDAWNLASKKYELPWINTCDLKGFESDAIINYHIWQTPTFYLLDSNRKMVARPINTAVLKQELESLQF